MRTAVRSHAFFSSAARNVESLKNTVPSLAVNVPPTLTLPIGTATFTKPGPYVLRARKRWRVDRRERVHGRREQSHAAPADGPTGPWRSVMPPNIAPVRDGKSPRRIAGALSAAALIVVVVPQRNASPEELVRADAPRHDGFSFSPGTC